MYALAMSNGATSHLFCAAAEKTRSTDDARHVGDDAPASRSSPGLRLPPSPTAHSDFCLTARLTQLVTSELSTMASVGTSDRCTRKRAGLPSANVDAESSRSLSNAATHFNASGRRSTVRSDIAPSGAGAESCKASWGGRSSGASAPLSEDEGGDVVGASFPGSIMAATSATPHCEDASDPGPVRKTSSSGELQADFSKKLVWACAPPPVGTASMAEKAGITV